MWKLLAVDCKVRQKKLENNGPLSDVCRKPTTNWSNLANYDKSQQRNEAVN